MNDYPGPEQGSMVIDRKSESYQRKQRLLKRAWDNKGDASTVLRLLNNLHANKDMPPEHEAAIHRLPRESTARWMMVLNLQERVLYEQWQRDNPAKRLEDYLEANQRFLPREHVEEWLAKNPSASVRDYVVHHGYVDLPEWSESAGGWSRPEKNTIH